MYCVFCLLYYVFIYLRIFKCLFRLWFNFLVLFLSHFNLINIMMSSDFRLRLRKSHQYDYINVYF